MQITFETRKRNTRFYVLRQEVSEGRSSEGHANFKQREADRNRDRQTERQRQRQGKTKSGKKGERQTRRDSYIKRETEEES